MLNDDMVDEEIVESEVELDDADVVEFDYDPPVQMGDPFVEVTKEHQEAAQMLKSVAMDAIFEGKFNEAATHLTEAITVNPKSNILYASRASVFLKLKKPNAAIRDADAALMIDPNSAKGYKIRGMGRALLGLWEEATSDLHAASKLDFDEETSMMLKKVEPNSKKIEEHRKKYENLHTEQLLRKIEREKMKKSQEAEYANILKDGKVIVIESSRELGIKLNASIKTSRLAVVCFTALWCGPSHYSAPIFESLAAKYPKVVFLEVDIDEVKDAALRWKVRSIPSFYILKEGKVIDKVVDIDMDSLEKKIVHHAE